MKQTYQLLIAAGLILLVSLGLLFSRILLNIEYIPPEVSEQVDSTAVDRHEGKPTVLIGVISRYAPYLIYEGYQPIMDYLTENSDYIYSLRLSSSYQDAADKLINGEVAASFFGTKIYLEMVDRADIEPILAPLGPAGTPFIHSMLITSNTSPVHTAHDLVGRSIALPSELSFSGQWGMIHLMRSNGLKIDSFLKIQHFSHHQTVVYKVLKHEYDVGVVKDRVAEEFANQGIRVLAVSPPFPSSPIVALHQRASSPEILKMKELLLKLDPSNETDRTLIRQWDPEFAYGFTEVSRDLYVNVKSSIEDSLREIFK